jgi:hypothetical protein
MVDVSHRHTLLSVIVLVWLSNCTPVVHDRLAPFNQAEYEAYTGEGTATISGEALPRPRDGKINKGICKAVYLTPVTGYFTEWFERVVMRGDLLAPAVIRAMAYARNTGTDHEGRFTFEKLPAGDYYVACPITWKVPGFFAWPSSAESAVEWH